MKNNTPNKKVMETIKPVETIQPLVPEQPKPTDYLKSESLEMAQLFKRVNATPYDVQLINKYYKKYIDPNFSGTRDSCNGCGNSVPVVFVKLRAWWSTNNGLFVN